MEVRWIQSLVQQSHHIIMSASLFCYFSVYILQSFCCFLSGENSSLSKDHLPLADNEESQFENHMALYEVRRLPHFLTRLCWITDKFSSFGFSPNLSSALTTLGQS